MFWGDDDAFGYPGTPKVRRRNGWRAVWEADAAARRLSADRVGADPGHAAEPGVGPGEDTSPAWLADFDQVRPV